MENEKFKTDKEKDLIRLFRLECLIDMLDNRGFALKETHSLYMGYFFGKKHMGFSERKKYLTCQWEFYGMFEGEWTFMITNPEYTIAYLKAKADIIRGSHRLWLIELFYYKLIYKHEF